MTRRKRLMATLQGRPVDRPAVNLYEVGGFLVNPADPDPFSIHHAPDCPPLLRPAEERTGWIPMMSPVGARSGEVIIFRACLSPLCTATPAASATIRRRLA